jgi:FkbM family methyltransferase
MPRSVLQSSSLPAGAAARGRPGRRWRLTIAVLIGVLGAGMLAVRFLPALVPLRLFLTGHTGTCSLAQAFQARHTSSEQFTLQERLAGESRRIETDPAGLELWETPRGRFWIPAAGAAGFSYELAEQERKIYGAGARGVHPGDVVLDCGAHVGAFTREALALGAGLVVAIEPMPQNIECMRRNLADEIAAGRVILFAKGVWDKDDVLTVQVDPDSSGGNTFVRSEGLERGADLPLTTIDEVVAELRLPRVDFIKMDIEGAEQKALAGASQTIQRYRPRLAVSTYHEPDDPVAIPALLKRLVPGYRLDPACSPFSDGIRVEVLFAE